MMKGTEKQIKWAEDIIDNCIRTAEVNIADLKEKIEKYPKVVDFVYELKGFEMALESIKKAAAAAPDAATIINNRKSLTGDTVLTVARQYAREYKEGRLTF